MSVGHPNTGRIIRYGLMLFTDTRCQSEITPADKCPVSSANRGKTSPQSASSSNSGGRRGSGSVLISRLNSVWAWVSAAAGAVGVV